MAAKFVEKRVKGVRITPYYGKIQDKDDDYYMQFSMIVCGLDSVEARKWINQKLIGLVKDYSDDHKALKPFVDGGTEGFKGQARVIYPTITSCIECQLDLHAPRAQVPLCTIATVPRQPQHCIEWAHQIAWSNERKDDTLDTDDPEHISWLYTRALARANEFSIPGVTYSMTQGVVKNIIPAIASTNAIIAAACCNEAFKILTNTAPSLGFPGTSNYMMYTGDEGVYTHTFEHQKKEDCPECGPARLMDVDGEWTLQELLKRLSDGETGGEFKQPTLSSGDGPLYYSQPASLEEHTRPNLKRKLTELLQDGEEVAVSDPAYQTQFRFKLSFR